MWRPVAEDAISPISPAPIGGDQQKGFVTFRNRDPHSSRDETGRRGMAKMPTVSKVGGMKRALRSPLVLWRRLPPLVPAGKLVGLLLVNSSFLSLYVENSSRNRNRQRSAHAHGPLLRQAARLHRSGTCCRRLGRSHQTLGRGASRDRPLRHGQCPADVK